MSKIDDMIARLCPDGVEYVRLDEAFDTRGGYTPSKNNPAFWENGIIPWFRMEDIREYGRTLTHASQLVNESALKKGGLMPAGSIIVATSATIGEHAILGVDALCNQRFTCLTKKPEFANRFNDRFLFHYCFLLDEHCKKNLTQGSFASVSMPAFYSFMFPVPPMEIQEEIVQVLDSFAELEAELEARRRQYAYYRDELLRFTERESVSWLKLGDIARVYDGTHQTPKYVDSGVRFVSVENIAAPYSSEKFITSEAFSGYKTKPQKGDVLMTRIGSIGACCVLDRDEDLAYYVSLALIRPDVSLVELKYVKHIIESAHGRRELYKRTLVNAVPIKVNLGDIGKIEIPVPPLEEQERIVGILDKFDALVNDISAGIPAEIEARHKQYAYYRDKLLDFAVLPNSETA